MRCIVPLLSMALLFPVSSKADDGIKFFDGYAHGWGEGPFIINLSKKRNYIYNGGYANSRYFNVNNFLEMSTEEYGNEELRTGDDFFAKNRLAVIDFLTHESEEPVERYYKPYGILNSNAFSMIFSLDLIRDSKIALIKGIKEKEYDVEWKYKLEKILSKFEFKPNLQVMEDDRLIIAGGNEPYLYVLDKNKKDNIIFTGKLFYAPMRYVSAVWKKTNGCPKIPFIETSHLKSDLTAINQCFEAIFRNHPIGEFNVKTPDTPNFRQFNRDFNGFE